MSRSNVLEIYSEIALEAAMSSRGKSGEIFISLICVFILLFVCVTFYDCLSVCLFVSLSVSVCVSVCLFVCVCICLSV